MFNDSQGGQLTDICLPLDTLFGKDSDPEGLTRYPSALTFATAPHSGTPPDGPPQGPLWFRVTPKLYPMPSIRKHDRRRPWKRPATRGKNSPSDGVRRFNDDGRPSRGWEGGSSGSDLDPRLKSRRWQRVRIAILSEGPTCRICDMVGAVTPATEVDHIVPRRLAPDLMFSKANLWGLCSDCHAEKTRLEFRGVEMETADRWSIAVLLRQGRLSPRDVARRGMGGENLET